jgi:hypothetical protein
MADAAPNGEPRRRFWLFAPLALLMLAAAAWTAAWFMIRNEAARALDNWIAREARAGRQWQCADRTIGGFPFRIEVSCDTLALLRPGSRLTLGATRTVAQVYRPRHLIAHVSGPLRFEEGPIRLAGEWRSLEASVRMSADGLQRASLVASGPELRLTGWAAEEIGLRAQRLETHLRPNPSRFASEGAYDWSLQAAGAVVPRLDDLIGGAEAADLDVQLTATQARDVAARPLIAELERWREARGRIEVTRLALAKGARRVEGKGQFGLDAAHRPQGRAEIAAAGVEGLLGTVLSARNAAANAIIGALTGRRPEALPQAPASATGAKSGLQPLPPLRIEGGRVLVGPVPVPGLRFPPLY